MAATPQRGDRHPIADLERGGLRSQLHDLARELVSEHGSGANAERGLLGHVQIAAADTASANPDDDLVGRGYGIRDRRHDERFTERFEYRRPHTLSPLIVSITNSFPWPGSRAPEADTMA